MPQLKQKLSKQIREDNRQNHLNDIQHLDVHGCLLWIMDTFCPTGYWSRAVWCHPAWQMSFTVNSAQLQDTLPHISNLVRWKRPVPPLCPLCGGFQTLRHILNGRKQALQEKQYDQRQDEVLGEIVTFLGGHLSAIDYHIEADLDLDTYTFPYTSVQQPRGLALSYGTRRPRQSTSLSWQHVLMRTFADANMRKQAKYHDLGEGKQWRLLATNATCGQSRSVSRDHWWSKLQPLHALCNTPKQEVANLYFKIKYVWWWFYCMLNFVHTSQGNLRFKHFCSFQLPALAVNSLKKVAETFELKVSLASVNKIQHTIIPPLSHILYMNYYIIYIKKHHASHYGDQLAQYSTCTCGPEPQ